MYRNILKQSGPQMDPVNDTQTQGRETERRFNDICVLKMDGRMYPVINWSLSGVMFFADPKVFSVGRHADLTLRFKLGQRVHDIPLTGKIARKVKDGVAIEFAPCTSDTRDCFETVIRYLSEQSDGHEDMTMHAND